MPKISIEQGLRGLQSFLAAEWRLALPIALAFHALPLLALSLIVQPLMRDIPQTIEGMRALGQTLPWWVAPAMIGVALFTVLGALSLIALALLPRVSVGEAIAVAFRRMPVWIGAALLCGVGAFVVLIVIGLLIGALPAGASLLMVATFLILTAGSLYMIMLMPLIIDRPVGPIAALRTGFLLYRGHVLRMVAGMVLFLVGCWILAMAMQVALGSVLLLLGRVIGSPDLGTTLVALLGAIVSALEWGAFYLLVAMLYRQHAVRT